MTEYTLPARAAQAHATPVYHADFAVTLDEVSRVCSQVHALALPRGGREWAVRVDLGLTEALTNLVRHGYAAKGHGRVTLTCLEAADQWQLMLKDRCSPITQALLRQADGSIFDFNPDDLQSIPERGIGLALMGSCFDGVDYQVHPDGNCLMLTKHFLP